MAINIAYHATAAGSSRPGKRILLTTYGSLGDLQPYLALGLELQARGHQAVIGTSARYRDRIEALGLEFAAIRPDLPDDDALPELLAKIMDARRGTETVVRDVVLPHVRAAFEDTLQAARGADLLVSHLLTFATPEVGHVLGIPWVTTILQPISLFSVYDPPVLGQYPIFNRLRGLGPAFWRIVRQASLRSINSWYGQLRTLQREIGSPWLGKAPMFEILSNDLVLALFSPLFGRPQPDWPPQTVATGFPFFDPPGGNALQPELQAFLAAGPPPLVFTLGSSAVMTPGDFYGVSVEATQRLGRRAVLLVGREGMAALPALPPLPPEILSVAYVPHGALFPHAAAVVHQGGIGTTAQAMRAGLPMLVVPFAHDQFDNAHRVEQLGIGLAHSLQKYTAGNVTQALHRLLTNPDFTRRAVRIGEQIRQEDGVGAACDALEKLL